MGIPCECRGSVSQVTRRVRDVNIAIRVGLPTLRRCVSGDRFSGIRLAITTKCPATALATTPPLSFSRTLLGEAISVVNNLVNDVVSLPVVLVATVPLLVRSPNPLVFGRRHINGGKHVFGVCGLHSVCASTRGHGTRLVTDGGVGNFVFGVSGSPQVAGINGFVEGADVSRLPRF